MKLDLIYNITLEETFTWNLTWYTIAHWAKHLHETRLDIQHHIGRNIYMKLDLINNITLSETIYMKLDLIYNSTLGETFTWNSTHWAKHLHETRLDIQGITLGETFTWNSTWYTIAQWAKHFMKLDLIYNIPLGDIYMIDLIYNSTLGETFTWNSTWYTTAHWAKHLHKTRLKHRLDIQ